MIIGCIAAASACGGPTRVDVPSVNTSQPAPLRGALNPDVCAGVPPAVVATSRCSNHDACEKACEAGDAYGCGDAGLNVAHTDKARAAFLLARACRAGAAGGFCSSAASLVDDPSVGADLNRLGCCMGDDGSACNGVALAYFNGEGRPLDKPRAVRFFERGCAAKSFTSEPCHQLAAVLFRGEGVAKDVGRAEALLIGLCDAGSKDDCFDLAGIYDKVSDSPRRTEGFRVLSTQCSSFNGTACYAVALLLNHNRVALRADGQPMANDRDTLIQLLGKACQFGEPRACAELTANGAPLP